MQRRRRKEWEYGSLAQSLLQPKSTVLHVCCSRWPLQVCKEFLLMRRRNGMCIVWGKTWVKKKNTEKCTESHPIYICLSILHLWNVRRGTCIMGSQACTYMHCNIHTTSLPLRISKESVFPGCKDSLLRRCEAVLSWGCLCTVFLWYLLLFLWWSSLLFLLASIFLGFALP